MSEQRNKSALRQELLEQIDEAMLTIALLDTEDEHIEELEKTYAGTEIEKQAKDFQLTHKDAITKKISSTIRTAKANKFVKRDMPRILQFVSIVVAIFFVGLSTAIATSSTIRASVLQFIINIGDEYTELSLQEPPELAFDVPAEWPGEYYPSVIPEGYILQNINSYEASPNVLYVQPDSDEEKYIRFIECDANTYMNIDTENAIVKPVVIRGNAGIISVKNDRIILAWANESKYFCLVYTGEKEDAIRLAQSIRKIN